MKKLLGLLVMLAVVVVLGGMAGCGGGDDDDDGGDATATATGAATEASTAGDDGGDVDQGAVQDYFDAVVEIADRTNTKLDEVNSRMSGATFASEAGEIEANQNAMQEIGQALEAAAIDLADLEPPEVVAGEHDAFASALSEYTQAASKVSGDLQDVTTLDEMNALYDEQLPAVNEAVGAAGETCLALETAGQQYIDGLDLACPGD